MNKKFKKCLISSLVGVSLSGVVVPAVADSVIYASELNAEINNYEELVEKYNFKYLSTLSEREQNLYKESLKKSVSKLTSKDSVYNVLESIDKYIAYEKGYVVYQDRSGSFWDGQGLTVGELGAAINGIVGAALAGGSGYAVNWYVKNKLKKQITGYLAAIGLTSFGKFASQIIDSVTNFLDLGGHIARGIDSIDFHANNGRINLWP